MVSIDLNGKAVLVTGGTRGIGKAVGLEFARAGATAWLTHRWGSVEEKELLDEFDSAKVPRPQIVECDVSNAEDIGRLMTRIKDSGGALDTFISNVAFSKVVRTIDELKRNALDLSLSYSAWPLVEHVKIAKEVLGYYPRHVVAVSSDGGQMCHEGYAFAGVSKSVLETLCRYLATMLRPAGVQVNALRPGFLDTASSRATFGDEVIERAKKKAEGMFLDPAVVARACLALSSGLMDSVSGQIITVDEGWSLTSPIEFLKNGERP